MNYRMIFRLLGVILISMGLAFLVSMWVGWLYDGAHEEEVLSHWYKVVGITFALAILCFFLGRKATTALFRKEGLTVIGVGWLLCSAVGALPYMLLLPACTFPDAFFEAASGLTTTGASVFGSFEEFPKSLIFWRCMSQWIGGLGVVVFFVAILSFLGAGAKILYSNESSGQAAEIGSSKIQKGVLEILFLYLFLSALCAGTYYVLGMDWFEAVCFMFATLSTGGFGVGDIGLTNYNNPLLEWMVIFYMVIGGTSFLIMLRFIKRNWSVRKESLEVYVYCGVIALATMIVFFEFLQSVDIDLEEGLRVSAFQVVSIMTTTGFATADFDRWVIASKVVLLVVMITGGCSGSTAGGCKLIRLIVAAKVCWRQIEKSFRARVIRPIYINQRNISIEVQESILVFLVLMGAVVLVGIFFVAFVEPHMSLEGVISSVFASIFNIGPGFAEVGPLQNFGFMLPITKVFLSFLMIMGRLELYAILVLFVPSLWKRFS